MRYTDREDQTARVRFAARQKHADRARPERSPETHLSARIDRERTPRRRAALRHASRRGEADFTWLRRATVLPALFVGAHACCLAHEGEPLAPHDLWSAWSWEPAIVLPILLSGMLYFVGVRRLWRGDGRDRGVRKWEAVCFASGWLVLVIALISPLHPMGEVLFSAHMVQHELLMLAAAPLLVLGRPLLPFLWSLPISWRRALGAAGNTRPFRLTWRFLSAPLTAWFLHAVALWGWHAPSLFQATLENETVHALQHISFLGSALLFSWAIVDGGRMGLGGAILYVFTTAVHSSILGALLTFGRTLWYPLYGTSAAAWGLTPLEDQQLGGLIMWVPAGVVYLVAGLLLVRAWARFDGGDEVIPTPRPEESM
jgi:cytochrome c oxidase assembly factor CtaG